MFVLFKRISFFPFFFCLVLLASLTVHATQVGATTPRVILVFGDSLSAGYGIATRQSWPALLDNRLQQEGKLFAIVNASISGETTAGGRARFETALRQFRPAIVILALGANDGLRGLPIVAMKNNLAAMIAVAKRHNVRVLLVGMRLPPNYGNGYTQNFAAAFRTLARREKVALLPFLLEPVALDAGAFQADGLHPTAAAQPKLAQHIWNALVPLLQ